MLKAVITGVAGQDGSYLAEFLLEKGYSVIGIALRHSASRTYLNIEKIIGTDRFKLVEGNICDQTLISRVLHDHRPHEWYNIAGMSHVGHSFREPLTTFDINARSVIGQLEAIKQISPHTRFYQASTSELFGGLACPESGYTEDSSFHPRSPYGVAKMSAYWSVVNYREAYNLFACNGILHNHSSPRRGVDFATRKITRGIAKVKLGLEKTVKMGDLSAFRDEGHSKDYCKAMWMMLQADEPQDYLVATGDGATIKEMFEYVCSIADLDFNKTYEKDPRFMRPSEVPVLLGNPGKIRDELGWSPEYSWKDLLKEMYHSDLNDLKKSM